MKHPTSQTHSSSAPASPARVALLSLSVGAAGMAGLAGLAGWRGTEPPPAATAAPAPVAPALPDRDLLAHRARQASEFAKLVQAYLDHEFLLESEKSTLRARAVILAAHAREQAERLRTLDGVESSNASFIVLDLGARADGLDDERCQLEREWAVWKVQHGLVTPEQTELIYTPPQGAGC